MLFNRVWREKNKKFLRSLEKGLLKLDIVAEEADAIILGDKKTKQHSNVSKQRIIDVKSPEKHGENSNFQ